MKVVNSIFRRELSSYFTTPLAYVFIVIFLALNGVFTFYLGGWYEREQADLQPFFDYHPLLYLFLIPALSMRLWAEERKTGTIELLMTLPVSTWQAVTGKYLAAWVFSGIALVLTFPVWLTANYLGYPDNPVILASYAGSFLMAGAYLAIGSCVSATTRNQVIAFVIAVVVCFIFLLSGTPLVLDLFQAWLPQVLIDTISGMSITTHFNSILKGVIDLRDIVFFSSFIVCWLLANIIVVEMKKSD
ncbi:MAG: ABC transporter permease [Gammaproteobacteria bacterium]|nr:MAG: ABC transporter permease [Gammaproteobacteria bacterium]